MTPADIKSLRKELGCTARELAQALEQDQKTVLAWEKGELFPTKRLVTKMNRLRDEGPAAIPRKPRTRPGKTGLDRTTDPQLWEVFRKLCAHPALFDQVLALADSFDDPSPE